MIVPQYWATGRIRVRKAGRQITVRRFGWSDTSIEDAQAMADARAREALDRIQSGEKLARREKKIGYNGAQGVPIREEIVARHGETILTRNSYGAVCLNSPDVLFVDVDTEPSPFAGDGRAFAGCFAACLGAVVSIVIGGAMRWIVGGAGAILAVLIGIAVGVAVTRSLRHRQKRENAEVRAKRNLEQFVADHPAWHLRLYQTPGGYRILVMHRTFAPDDPEVKECFRGLGADPVYTRMCANQQCFRARLTPKPWRTGMQSRMKPRPGVWPINPERIPDRQRWVAEYEEWSEEFAACRFLRALGDTTAVHPSAERVRALHDEICRADSDLPLA